MTVQIVFLLFKIHNVTSLGNQNVYIETIVIRKNLFYSQFAIRIKQILALQSTVRVLYTYVVDDRLHLAHAPNQK